MTPPESAELQVDLATVIARLEQLGEMVSESLSDPLAFLLWQRVIESDVPRLRGYLTPETLARLEAVQSE